MIQKVFSIGNSVAVTIPNKVGILPGTRLRHLSTRKNRIAYEVIEDEPRVGKKDKMKEAYLKRVTGGLKVDIPTPKLMEIIAYCREHPYEKF